MNHLKQYSQSDFGSKEVGVGDSSPLPALVIFTALAVWGISSCNNSKAPAASVAAPVAKTAPIPALPAAQTTVPKLAKAAAPQ